MESIIQKDMEKCFLCGGRASEEHHPFFGSKRKWCVKYGLSFGLCHICHRGDSGVHGRDGHEKDMFLKQIAQERFEEEYSHEEFMKVFGKNYL